jgi:hypothetical protein
MQITGYAGSTFIIDATDEEWRELIPCPSTFIAIRSAIKKALANDAQLLPPTTPPTTTATATTPPLPLPLPAPPQQNLQLQQEGDITVGADTYTPIEKTFWAKLELENHIGKHNTPTILYKTTNPNQIRHRIEQSHQEYTSNPIRIAAGVVKFEWANRILQIRNK